MRDENVIGAFSDEQAARISGLSIHQLREWDRQGFFKPSYGSPRAHVPYGRIYSFRDLVSLQVLSDLRNRKKIPLQHLKLVSEKLAHLGDARWTATTLYVLGKRVVFENPNTRRREEVVSGQRVFNIPLRVVIKSTRDKIEELGERSERAGIFEARRFVAQNHRVFAGTRIPVVVIADYLRAGVSEAKIIAEFPVLRPADIDAAKEQMDGKAA